MIENVLNAGKALGHRDGQNPAAWRGHLALLLPRPDKTKRTNFARLPHALVPQFMATLRARKSRRAGMALQFLILTAGRLGEGLGATWGEIDAAEKVWTIPASRMKARREHRVPLSPQAMAILEGMALGRGFEGEDAVSNIVKAKPTAFIFQGNSRGSRLSDAAIAMLFRRMEKAAGEDWIKITAHGFRSSFRDWTGDETTFQREVAEAALAHAVGNATEQAYRRGDALTKRRKLMEAWANYCDREIGGNVRQFKKSA